MGRKSLNKSFGKASSAYEPLKRLELIKITFNRNYQISDYETSYLLQHILYFLIQSGLFWCLLSEHIIGDVYSAGRL